jgi:hypothetical protein
MADKKCPRCGLWNTESAIRCDCGYDFASNTVKESYSAPHSISAPKLEEMGRKHMTAGAIWFAAGFLATVVFYVTASENRSYLIYTIGALLFGLARFARGAMEYNKARSAR